ncbi:MAG TPA: alpha/beta hydrolase [Actinomycetota bacterium]|nr:alpha/beta hydrolase [Actinomycetota bacterium]
MSTVTSKDGTTIAFETTGEGPPLVIVGGALSDRHAAATQAGLLAPNFTVSAYDRRGRGDSGDRSPYAVEREIEDLQALVEEAGGTTYALGHSSGAVLALDAATATPGITKLVLYEPPFVVDDSRPPLPDDYVQHLDELAASGRRGEAVEYFMTTGVGVPAEAIPSMKESPFWPSLEAMAHTLSYDGRIMGDNMAGKPLPSDRWSTVTIPTLVIDGGASPPSLRNAVQALVDVLPNARRLTLQGQTHEVDPTILTPVLVEFLTS